MSQHLEQDCSQSKTESHDRILRPSKSIHSADAFVAVKMKSHREDFFSRLVGIMDIAGVFASTLCMVHCLLLPIIFALLPVFARPLMEHDWLHVGLAGFVLTFCLMAYVPGFLRHHDKRLLLIGAVGLTLVFFATFVARQWGEIAEISILTAGNTVLVFGHLLNRKLLSHSRCAHP